ncbi:MAG: thioredoxin family protein [Armatimonadetes bacterium]|nr:thioredoxin family protein [Armatimonadota bacterium]
MRTVAIPVALLMMCLVSAGWAEPIADTKPQASIKWAASLEEALEQAEKAAKPVFVDVYSDLCYYCSKMHREVFPNRKIIDLSTKFVCVKVNADKRKDVPRKYNVGPLPTYLFLTAKGDLVSQSVGYLPVDPFSVKMQRALELFAAQAELAELKVKREDGTATGAELVRLAYLLRRSEKIGEARAVATEAIAALPEAHAALSDAKLELALARLADEERGASAAIEEWIAVNPDSARRWEAKYELGMAEAHANRLAAAAKLFNEVIRGSRDSEFGIMAAHYSKIIDDILACPTGGG